MLLVSWRANSTVATCAWRLCAGLRPGQRDVLGWGWCCLQAPFCPAKGKPQRVAGVGGSSREEVGRASLPPPCCWTSLGKSLCPVALLLPAHSCLGWQVFTSHLQVSYIWFFSFFFCPRLLGITQGCFSKDIFPWQEHDPIDALPARTSAQTLRYSHLGAEPRPGHFWENPQLFEKEGQNPCGREL